MKLKWQVYILKGRQDIFLDDARFKIFRHSLPVTEKNSIFPKVFDFVVYSEYCRVFMFPHCLLCI